MAMTQQERDQQDAKTAQEKPINDWLAEIAATDAKMPRYLEDHIRDDHGGVTSCPVLQASYDEKVETRLRKPS